MNFEIKDFTESDKGIAFELFNLADPWAKENDRLDILESNWQKILSPSKSLNGVAVWSENQLIGYGLYFFATSIKTVGDECQIRDLFIHPGFRLKGAGTVLMQHIEKTAKEERAGRIFWAINAARKDSIAFLNNFHAEKREETVFIKWFETV